MFSKIVKSVVCVWMLVGMPFSAAFSAGIPTHTGTSTTTHTDTSTSTTTQNQEGGDSWGAGS